MQTQDFDDGQEEVLEVDPNSSTAETLSLRDELASHLQEDEGEKQVNTDPKAEAPLKEAQPTALDKSGQPTAPQATVDAPPKRLETKFPAAEWAALPPKVKEAYREYESNMGRMADRYGKAAKSWEAVQQVITPYEEMIRSEGGNPIGAIQSLFETARVLRVGTPDQKLHLIYQMAQVYNIPLQRGEQGQAYLPPLRTDPAILERLGHFERQALTHRGSEDHNIRQRVNDEIDEFAANPAHIYLQEPGYLDTMTMLIQQGKASNLPEAYEQAAWLHGPTRDMEIAKRNQPAVQNRARQVASARAAAVSTPGNAPGVVSRNRSQLSLRDTLAAALDGELDD